VVGGRQQIQVVVDDDDRGACVEQPVKHGDQRGHVERVQAGRLTVSRVGFGAMQLPGPGVFGPPRDRGEAIAVLRRGAELGVDHIDTAQFYGPDVANELIRAALYPYPEGLALVSKVGARRDSLGRVLRFDAPAQLTQGIEDDLRSLSADHLPAVNLRLMDDAKPGQQFDDQLTAMLNARDRGLIGGIGLNILLIPGTSSVRHLEENMAVTDIELDEAAREALATAGLGG
jgi:aryl-alcohol dehydrogenase-like predicted oxidoreductase